jgi:6-phosphogluconolactonase
MFPQSISPCASPATSDHTPHLLPDCQHCAASLASARLQPTRTLQINGAEIRVLPDASALARAAADEFSRLAKESVAVRGRFTVALSGGSTPKAIFQLLATDHANGVALPWDRIQIFFGDERHVPPDHVDSNFRMANEHLLSKVPIPAGNVHRIEGEREAVEAATRYEAELRSTFTESAGSLPRFDLIFLGMGADGHTASLFPGSSALDEQRALVCATWVEKFRSHRITFTFPLINAAAHVLFVAGGADKTAMLRHVLHGDPSGQTYPSQRIRPTNGDLVWLVDEAAAQAL